MREHWHGEGIPASLQMISLRAHPPSSTASSCPRKSLPWSSTFATKRSFSNRISRSFMRSATKVLNQEALRNLDRFPADFMFQLTEYEMGILRSQIVTSKIARSNLICQSGRAGGRGGRRYPPYCFTGQGGAMRRLHIALKGARLLSMVYSSTGESGDSRSGRFKSR
jgi:hypothetical protein